MDMAQPLRIFKNLTVLQFSTTKLIEMRASFSSVLNLRSLVACALVEGFVWPN